MELATLFVALSLLGFICGIVALRRIRSGTFHGRGLAWTGIVLGGLPLAVLVAYMVYSVPEMWRALCEEINGRARMKEKFGPP
jgi:hypothetical protein